MLERWKTRQGDFSDISSDFSPRVSLEAKKLRHDIYHNALQRLKGLGIDLLPPSVINQNPDIKPVYDAHRNPMIKDILIPDELQSLLREYGAYTGKGDKSKIIQAGVVFDQSGLAGLTEEELKNPLIALPPDHPYHEWFAVTTDAFRNQPLRLAGWEGTKTNIYEIGDRYDVLYSTTGKLTRLTYLKPHPELVIRKYTNKGNLRTTATFRGGAFWSLWQEFPNGTFFEDPKGAKESIWPHWVNGTNGEFYEPGPGTRENWEVYLKRTRERQRVISPKTSEYVYQSETQARRNLEEWRTYIYHLHPQVVYVKSIPDEPGLQGVMGYRAFGEYGAYISKNPASYQQLATKEAFDLVQHVTF